MSSSLGVIAGERQLEAGTGSSETRAAVAALWQVAQEGLLELKELGAALGGELVGVLGLGELNQRGGEVGASHIGERLLHKGLLVAGT